MACFHPLTAYIGKDRTEKGKQEIVFSLKDAFCSPTGKTFSVHLPCGRCIGCRLQRVRTWSARCVHEASLYDNNCFITLTFSEDFPSKAYTLQKPDFQKFMKRLRSRFPDRKIRFFHCGEYGSVCSVTGIAVKLCYGLVRSQKIDFHRCSPDLGRAHHHACLFNFDFPDKEVWREKAGFRLYRSAILESLWSDPKTKVPYGYCTIGDVTFESASYVASYVVKKITGEPAEDHYKGRTPEYVTMSRRPGIGKDWIEQYCSDVYPHDFVIIRGNKKVKPPRYYDDQFAKIDNIRYNRLKVNREKIARLDPNNSPKRLMDREKYTNSLLKLKEREYETQSV